MAGQDADAQQVGEASQKEGGAGGWLRLVRVPPCLVSRNSDALLFPGALWFSDVFVSIGLSAFSDYRSTVSPA